MKKWLKLSLIILVVLVAAAQVVRPARTNPPIDPKKHISAHMQVDPAVMATLSRACNDCHSNQTEWPWYSNVAPVSWLVAHDVNSGRKELNLSEWGTGREKEPGERLSKICKEVTDGEMPMATYTLMHPRAKLTSTEVQNVCRWTKSMASNVAETTKDKDDDD
ncbi:MAG: heme-binding domain-containing protein [Acidobacteriia bacterium]|nr:heme-binding domain-containing protein [Terriglobia bacterium]